MTVKEILKYFELQELETKLDDWGIDSEWIVSEEDNPDRVDIFRNFIEANIGVCAEIFTESNRIYKKYITGLLEGVSGNVAVVDVGWRGTAGLMLKRVIQSVRRNVDVYSFLCGSRQSGNIGEIRKNEINCYLFSAEKNYDALFKHGEKTNYCYELLLTSATPSFGCFSKNESGETVIKLGKDEVGNNNIILEIQRGIKDFVGEYTYRFRKYSEMYKIPASDVTQILYGIMSHEEYFKSFFGEFFYSPEIGETQDLLVDWV